MRAIKFETKCIMLICAAMVTSCHIHGSISPVKKMVIDTDGVFDDVFAMMMALEAQRLDNGPEIVAITCVNGVNTHRNCVVNVLKILHALNRTDIPVYAGAASPIILPNQKDLTYGKDGFGDFGYPDPPSMDLVHKTHAVNALIALAKKCKGELTVVSIAPQTNIALAIRMYPPFLDDLQQLIVMGGSTEGRGNVRPGIDYNSICDPPANYVVFSSAKSKLVNLVYLETTVRARIPMSFRLRLNECGNIKSWLLKKGEAVALDPHAKYWYCPDAVGMIVALTSGGIVTKSKAYYMDAIYDGIRTQGMTVVDYTNITGNAANTNLIQNIDVKQYKQLLLHYFCEESGSINSR